MTHQHQLNNTSSSEAPNSSSTTANSNNTRPQRVQFRIMQHPARAQMNINSNNTISQPELGYHSSRPAYFSINTYFSSMGVNGGGGIGRPVPPHPPQQQWTTVPLKH